MARCYLFNLTPARATISIHGARLGVCPPIWRGDAYAPTSLSTPIVPSVDRQPAAFRLCRSQLDVELDDEPRSRGYRVIVDGNHGLGDDLVLLVFRTRVVALDAAGAIAAVVESTAPSNPRVPLPSSGRPASGGARPGEVHVFNCHAERLLLLSVDGVYSPEGIPGWGSGQDATYQPRAIRLPRARARHIGDPASFVPGANRLCIEHGSSIAQATIDVPEPDALEVEQDLFLYVCKSVCFLCTAAGTVITKASNVVESLPTRAARRPVHEHEG